ncbi:nuclease-related domain-containing protein [Gracilibacillus kekensis]|uniref:Nuclease-related domain-containing protein n=1 Tax=Gracilibacillus kekensis TaxID=1027249 RepID=A0A1M7Q895_9BACI|nr:nuclease-related domain-containing protein [Gracilibacillus kekensis]SHN26578.1 Nuclease-related domain-containing protein [Gracilibacillus kekensis]
MNERYLDIPSKTLDLFRRELSGYLGEKSLPYYVDLTNTTSHYDLYSLRLKPHHHYFQIDGLFLFPTFFLITEVKHLKGKLFINESNQLIQIKDQVEKVYQHPLTQANLQKTQLQPLLTTLGYPDIPVHPVAIFTHDQAQLSFHHPDMIPVQQFPYLLQKLVSNYNERIYGMDQLSQLSKELVTLHQERSLTFLEPKREVLSNIRRGVFCPNCKPKVMRWTHGTWTCSMCGHRDKNAHIDALCDFIYLFGYYINNKQAKWFLLVDSPFSTSRILGKLRVETIGGTKFRVYNLKSLLGKYKR